LKVDNSLTLYEYQPPAGGAGFASGGYMANMLVGAGHESVAPGAGHTSNEGALAASKGGRVIEDTFCNQTNSTRVDGNIISSDCCGLKEYDCCVRLPNHAGAVAATLYAANGTCVYHSKAAAFVTDPTASVLQVHSLV
jgi:hypothetical protein